jgi:ferritin
MNQKLVSAIVKHIALEETAARVYRNAAGWCAKYAWTGTCKKFHSEADEENGHASKWCQYAELLKADITLAALPAIAAGGKIQKLVDVYEAALKIEQEVLDDIDRICTLSEEEGDCDTDRFLHEFSKAGREQIDWLQTMVDRLKRAGDCTATMELIDHDAGVEA